MTSILRHSIRSSIVAALFTLALSWPAFGASESRNILWNIVSNCLDPGAPDYCAKCRWPLPDSTCAAELICRKTTAVWAETEAYVVLRDPKMCGCPKEFVHGLVVPRSRVTGVEDPRHPDGIWGFAWAMARKIMGEDPAAALAVNPPQNRGQDQLHIHIVRLQDDARRRFSPHLVTRVASLDDVWSAAGRTAAAAGIPGASYGILVTSHPEGGFIVLVDQESPEKKYLVARCRKDEERKK